jgi:putative nucleotidyltransferase with HDIG domain
MKRAILLLLKDPKTRPDFRSVPDWVVAESPNMDHALQALTLRDYQAVVADIEFQLDPEIALFEKVMNRNPKVCRIALCDLEGRKPLQSALFVHQYVRKPGNPELILAAVERALFLDRWMADPKIKQLFPQLRKLPTVPAIYFRLLRELQSPSADIEQVGKIIAEDPVLTAQVLKVVNSAYFGLERTITSALEAVTYLGVERTKALALVTHTFKQFGEADTSVFSIDSLWRHSIRTGNLAQTLVRDETGDNKMAEIAYTAAVLHDVGKLMVAANLPVEYQRVARESTVHQLPFQVAERNLLGATHAEIGACLMGTWGLPPRVVQPIAYHHNPEMDSDPRFNPTAALHLANAFEHHSSDQTDRNIRTQLNCDYLAGLGLADRLDAWNESYGVPPAQAA